MYQRGWELFLLSAVVSVFSVPALATTYDLKDNPNCTLPEAIEAISWQKAVGACEAGTGNDRILLVQKETYQLDKQLKIGGGTKPVPILDENGKPTSESENKPIERLTLRIGVASEPGQRNEEKEMATIAAHKNDRAFWIGAGHSLELEHVHITGGDVTGERLEVEWEAKEVDVPNGEGEESPTKETVHTFKRFREAPFGGAIFVEGTLTTRTKVEIEGGTARKGGAIYMSGPTLSLADVKVTGAKVEANDAVLAAAHYVDNDEEEVSAPSEWNGLNEEYENTTSGGAIHMQKGRVILERVQFKDNKAAESGGAVATQADYQGDIVGSASSFYNNVAAKGNGGAIYMAPTSPGKAGLMLVNSLFTKNHAKKGGSAIHIDKNNSANFNNLTVFQNNTEAQGAGVWLHDEIHEGVFYNSAVLANTIEQRKAANYLDFIRNGEYVGGYEMWFCWDGPKELAEEDKYAFCYENTEKIINAELDEEDAPLNSAKWFDDSDEGEEWFQYDSDWERKSLISFVAHNAAGRLDKEWQLITEDEGSGEIEQKTLASWFEILEGWDDAISDLNDEICDLEGSEEVCEALGQLGETWKVAAPEEVSNGSECLVLSKSGEIEGKIEICRSLDDESTSEEDEPSYEYVFGFGDGSASLLTYKRAWLNRDSGSTSSEDVGLESQQVFVDFVDFDSFGSINPNEVGFEELVFDTFESFANWIVEQGIELEWSQEKSVVVAEEGVCENPGCVLSENLWVGIQNDGNFDPIYIKNEGDGFSLTNDPSLDGSGPVVNINQIGSLNSINYLWHGNTSLNAIYSNLPLDEQRKLLRGKVNQSESHAACDAGCDPIESEGTLIFIPNYDATDFGGDSLPEYALFGNGAPYVNQPEADASSCESKDIRGFTRQDRCDAGAVDFQRALGEKDTFYITVGGRDTFDVLKNDLGDADVDCRRVEEKMGNEYTPESCLNVVIKSTRAGVQTTTVVDENGYPQIAYDSGSGFHGHDYFEYRVSKDAFPPNTTLGANDVGARVAVVSEPGSGIKSDSVDQIGSAHFAWLLGLLGFSAVRRGKAKRYALALGILALTAFPAANAAEVKVSNQKDSFIEASTQYLTDVCTLRAAIASTEAPPTNTACSQGSGGVSRDIILLPAGDFVLWDTLKVNQNNPIEIRGEGPDKTTIRMREDDEICARLFETESALTLSHLTLEGGCAKGDPEGRGGGALYVHGSRNSTPPSIAMTNVHVKKNKAENVNGGAVYLAYRGDNKADASFDRVFFEENTAASGGAIYLDAFGNLSRNIINITNSTFSGNEASDGAAISSDGGENVKFNIVNSLFFNNGLEDQAVVGFSNYGGQAYVLNSTFLSNRGFAFKLNNGMERFALHNSVVDDEVEVEAKMPANKLQTSFNLLSGVLECEDGTDAQNFCLSTSKNNSFINGIGDLHDGELTFMKPCGEEDKDCQKQQNRWFVPYLIVTEKHDEDGDSNKLCEVTVNDEDGNESTKKVSCIIERGNPNPQQTGVSTPANCRTTDMRGKTREAGGQCDRGAYEVQINTPRPDTGNNANRRSRTALLNVLRNDIPGDDMWLRTGTLKVRPLTDLNIEEDSEDERVAELRKHFGDKNDKLEKFLKGGKTQAEEKGLIVVKAETVEKNLGEDPIPQYYDDITIVNADGREDPQSTDRAHDSRYQCDGTDQDENCLIYYEAPEIYMCHDLPFEDYFAYSVEAWKYDSTEPLNEDGLPDFIGDKEEEEITGYVQVTIDNIPPIVPRAGITHRIGPGGSITINLKNEGVRPIEGGVDKDTPIKIKSVTLEKEPQFAVYDRRTHEVLGEGIIIDESAQTVTYRHRDATKRFADTFSVKVTDSCGASSIVPIRIEFEGADDEGGSTPWAVTLLLVLLGAARRKLGRAA